MKGFRAKTNESVSSILPISGVVLLLCISIAPLGNGILTLFLFGMLFLILGMGLFALGSEMSMQPLGEGIGVQLSKSRRLGLTLLFCFLLGAIVTIAEPDLQVLAGQIPSIPNAVLILCVAAGVGLFLLIARLRTLWGIPLSRFLWICYPLAFVLALFAPKNFIPAAFDSGGVTTGPITVPFIMALGAGMTAVRSDRNSGEDSFGLISLCSVGPILSVMILSICYAPQASSVPNVIPEVLTTREAFFVFITALPAYAKEVLFALTPIAAVFLLFQLIFRRFSVKQVIRISVGMIYTYFGLVLFLTGANVGFMPAGQLLGSGIAGSAHKWLLIPVGMVIGYFVVAAEPAVVVLKKQVEEVSNGAISRKSVGSALAVGVAISVGISMLRVLTGLPLLPILLVGYAVALGISLFVPGLYTGVAFDSGGVASGPMTTTFLLPFAVGACEALGGDLMTDAFGIVAMVAMTPLITIQLLGLVSRIRSTLAHRRFEEEFAKLNDCIVYFDRTEVPTDATAGQ